MTLFKAVKPISLLGALIFQGSAIGAEPDWMILEGKARELESGQHIYTERHSLALEASGTWVMETDYLSPQGDLWAERVVWFHPSRLSAPDYQFTDYRDGYEEGASRLENGAIELYKGVSGERSSVVLDTAKSSRLVIDAGFSAVIEQNWESLLTGQSVTFDFASSARLTTVEFRLSHRKNRDKEGNLTSNDENVEQFKLEPANWLVRMLVKPIFLTYNRQLRTLIAYEGISNLRREGGGNYLVDITFPPDHQFTMRQLPSELRQAMP